MYLFDTNAIAEVVRRRPNPDYVAWLGTVPREAQHTSILVIGELCVSIAGSSAPEKWRALVDEQVLPRLTILEVDLESARRYGRVRAALSAQGTPIGDMDAWIAATALRFGLTVVTANRRHFERVEGLAIHSFTPGRAG